MQITRQAAFLNRDCGEIRRILHATETPAIHKMKVRFMLFSHPLRGYRLLLLLNESIT